MFNRQRFVWHEPWFFWLRVRPLSMWLLILGIALAVFCVVAALMFFLPANQRPWSEIIFWSAASSGVLLFWFEANLARRVVVLDQNGLLAAGQLGKYSLELNYPLTTIRYAAIVRDRDINRSYHLLTLQTDDGPTYIGIGKTLNVSKLAQAFHRLGVTVALSDWSPDEVSDFDLAFAYDRPIDSVLPTARVDSVPINEPKLFTPTGFLSAFIQQTWLFLIWFVAAGVAAWYAWNHWAAIDPVHRWIGIGVLVVTFCGAWYYLEIIGAALASRKLTEVCRDQIRERPTAVLDGHDPGCMPIEVMPRDQFAKNIQHLTDMGMLLVQKKERRILFEGKTQRWQVPFESVAACQIEEVQLGTEGESEFNALTYYVVLTFRSETETHEHGLKHSYRDFGKETDIRRAANAITLYEAIVDAIEN